MPTDLADECVYTIVHVDRLRAAQQRGKPTRSGRKIAPKFIRPYALCRAPTFLARA